MDNSNTAGGTRVFLFVRPAMEGSPIPDWKSLTQTIVTAGGQVHEECSGGIPGYEHADLVIQATLKDFNKIPQLVSELRRTGLKASVYPWVSSSEFTQTLSQSSSKYSGASTR